MEVKYTGKQPAPVIVPGVPGEFYKNKYTKVDRKAGEMLLKTGRFKKKTSVNKAPKQPTTDEKPIK